MRFFILIISLIVFSGCVQTPEQNNSAYFVSARDLFTDDEVSQLTNLLKTVHVNYSTSIVVVVPPKRYDLNKWLVNFKGFPPDLTIIINEKKYNVLRHQFYTGQMTKELVFEATTNLFFPQMKSGNYLQAIIKTVAFLTNNRN